jgi:hypothetical protein
MLDVVEVVLLVRLSHSLVAMDVVVVNVAKNQTSAVMVLVLVGVQAADVLIVKVVVVLLEPLVVVVMVVVQTADVVVENVVRVTHQTAVTEYVHHLVMEKDAVEMAVLVRLDKNVAVTLAPVALIPMEKNVVMANAPVGET